MHEMPGMFSPLAMESIHKKTLHRFKIYKEKVKFASRKMNKFGKKTL